MLKLPLLPGLSTSIEQISVSPAPLFSSSVFTDSLKAVNSLDSEPEFETLIPKAAVELSSKSPGCENFSGSMPTKLCFL
jgi:hypothetical protein